MAMTATCSKCGAPLKALEIAEVPASSRTKSFPAVALLCASCGAVLGVAPDPTRITALLASVVKKVK